jgi:hypothetical protein
MTHTLTRSIRIALGIAILLTTSTVSATDSHHSRDGNQIGPRSPLVEKVRAATEQYRNINVAIGEGWVPATPCVSGPNSGAMGVHMVLPSRVGDGQLRADQPEALIYEPLPNGRMRLVGVEFIVIQEHWDTQHPNDQPKLDGHLLHLIGAPNRYRLPAFYEIHVWAWAKNPEGNFADWNPTVSCDSQQAE